MKKLPLEISKQVLTIGPDYKNHRGGVGAVIEIYSRYFEQFQFLASYKAGSRLNRVLFFIWSILKFLKRLIFNKSIRVIHIHGASNGSFYRKFIYFFIAKYLFKKKIVYHIHGGGYETFYKNASVIVQSQVRRFVENSDCVVCLSEKWQLFIQNNFSCKKVFVIPNIIDYPTVTVVEREKSTQLNFLFLGLICNNKGIFDLIEVIANNKNFYNLRVKLFIGGNGEVERLLNTIKLKSLEGIVEYIGWVSNTEKSDYLAQSDVYILPSYIEGLPISILEAMSYGKPIISTNVGGIPEIVIPNTNGFIIKPGDLESIDSTIRYCIENKNSLFKLGKESKSIVSKYLPHNVLYQLEELYKSIIE